MNFHLVSLCSNLFQSLLCSRWYHLVPAQTLRYKSYDLFYKSLCASGLELGYTFGKYRYTKLCNCFKKWSRLESCIINIAYLPYAQSEYILIPQQGMLYQKGLSDKKPFDIYHDSNIQEVVRVKPILADFAARVHELLAKWPRHPALMQVRPLYLFVLKFISINTRNGFPSYFYSLRKELNIWHVMTWNILQRNQILIFDWYIIQRNIFERVHLQNVKSSCHICFVQQRLIYLLNFRWCTKRGQIFKSTFRQRTKWKNASRLNRNSVIFKTFALFQLLVVIERILSFPVTSPVMKILTGLEVLLRKAQVRSWVAVHL